MTKPCLPAALCFCTSTGGGDEDGNEDDGEENPSGLDDAAAAAKAQKQTRGRARQGGSAVTIHIQFDTQEGAKVAADPPEMQHISTRIRSGHDQSSATYRIRVLCVLWKT